MLPYLIVGAIIFFFLVIPTYRSIRREEEEARALQKKAEEEGEHEPVSIRPHVNLSRCIASGACILACPEQKILQIIDGHAQIVQGAHCVGHGACEAACPTKAIELVFGSERRGIDIPAVAPDFQSNMPDLYIAGELGGMGLIANAVDQGVQAVGNLARELPKGHGLGVDVVIVGAGPAGLGAALKAVELGLTYALLEQGEFGGALRHYPRQKLVMTRPMRFPIYGKVKIQTIRKEALIALFEEIVSSAGIEVSSPERVTASRPLEGGGFEVTTTKRTLTAARVLLAVGRRGTPRRLEVPGEEQEKVAYRLIDPELYQHAHLLVVGGGDSALEAACDLSEQTGNRVTLSYRRANFSRPKPANKERLQAAVDAGRITLAMESRVERIELDRVVLREGGEEQVLANDYVFVFAGGVLPTKLLSDCGVQTLRHFGKRVEAIPEA